MDIIKIEQLEVFAYHGCKEEEKINGQKFYVDANLYCDVVKIKNNFFGGHITVTGLVTGSDLIAQLKGKKLGEYLLISASMMRFEKDKFLDNITVEDVEKTLKVKVAVVDNDGFEFISNLLES